MRYFKGWYGSVSSIFVMWSLFFVSEASKKKYQDKASWVMFSALLICWLLQMETELSCIWNQSLKCCSG